MNFFKNRHQIQLLNRLKTMTIHLMLKVITTKIMNQIMILGVRDVRQSQQKNFYTASVLNVYQTQLIENCSLIRQFQNLKQELQLRLHFWQLIWLLQQQEQQQQQCLQLGFLLKYRVNRKIYHLRKAIANFFTFQALPVAIFLPWSLTKNLRQQKSPLTECLKDENWIVIYVQPRFKDEIFSLDREEFSRFLIVAWGNSIFEFQNIWNRGNT